MYHTKFQEQTTWRDSYLAGVREFARLGDVRVLLSPLDDAGGAVCPSHDPAVSLDVEVLLVGQHRVAPEI